MSDRKLQVAVDALIEKTEELAKELPPARKQIARCTGQCCTLIPLFSDTQGQLTGAQLAQLVEDEREFDGQIAKDKRVILDMVIPFEGPWTERGDAGRHENWWHGPVYTCKHFDGKDCGIYEDCPDLCKRYGVAAGAPCMFSDCEMKLAPVEGLMKKQADETTSCIVKAGGKDDG